MGDSLKQVLAGTLGESSSTAHNDAKHTVRRNYVFNVAAAIVGAAADNWLVGVTQTAIKVNAFYMVSGLALGNDANNPTFTLKSGDLASGSLTSLSSAIDSAPALAARTKLAATISTSAVAAGVGLWIAVATQGTPADITEDTQLTFVIEYELTN